MASIPPHPALFALTSVSPEASTQHPGVAMTGSDWTGSDWTGSGFFKTTVSPVFNGEGGSIFEKLDSLQKCSFKRIKFCSFNNILKLYTNIK